MRKLSSLLCLGLFLSTPLATAEPPSEPSLLDVALSVNEATGEFSTLLAAAEYAGLAGALDANRHFTVFAPTDAAFQEIGLDASNVDTVPLADLTAILLYHLSPGDRFAEDIVASTRVRMLNREFTVPDTVGSEVFINDAQVVTADIACRNGVIHVIDGVLLPMP